MSILIIKCSTDPIMFSGISEKENAKDCLWSSSISLRDLSRVGSIVEFIETFRQVLNSCHVLNLEEIFLYDILSIL